MAQPQFTHDDIRGWVKNNARIPGWTRWTAGKSNRYESPQGAIIGETAYRTIYRKYVQGIVIDVVPDTHDKTSHVEPLFSPTESDTDSVPPSSPAKPTNPIREAPRVEQPQVIDLPEAVLTPGKKQSGKATAKELAGTFAGWLAIITMTIAMFSHMPEVAMTKEEIAAISVPLANLFEKSKLNERFGKAIVGSNDYVLLGYALYTYMYRVNTTMTARRLGIHHAQPIGNYAANGPVPAEASTGGASNGVHLHSSPSGLRGITPLSN